MVDYMGHNGQYSFHTGSVKCKIIIFIDIYNYRPINSYINVALSSGPVLSGVRGINMAVKMLIVTFPWSITRAHQSKKGWEYKFSTGF